MNQEFTRTSLEDKSVRHIFYKKLLKQVCNDPNCNYGLCYAACVAAKWVVSNPLPILPEIYDQKPVKSYWKMSLYWFPLTQAGWRKRIAIIEKAIEMTKPDKSRKR